MHFSFLLIFLSIVPLVSGGFGDRNGDDEPEPVGESSGDDGAPPPIDSEKIQLCPSHPDIDALLARGAAPYDFPTTHPTVHPLLAPYMPSDHPNVDRLLERGEDYPSDHPTVSPYIYIVPADQACMSFDNYINASGCPVDTSSLHPSVDDAIANGETTPANHPNVHAMLAEYMPSNHRNIDDLMRDGVPLPFGHPPIDPYMCRNGTNYTYATGCPMNVSATHPSVDVAIAAGDPMPNGHPKVDGMLRDWMPAGHPDIDALMAAKTPLPLGHPLVDAYMCQPPPPEQGCASVFHGHPAVNDELNGTEKLPSGHPKIDPLFRPYLPEGHGDCDWYIEQGTPIPSWHPNIDDYICEESFLTAGLLLCFIVAGLFVLLVIHRFVHRYLESRHDPAPKRHVHVMETKRADAAEIEIGPVGGAAESTTLAAYTRVEGVALGEDDPHGGSGIRHRQAVSTVDPDAEEVVEFNDGSTPSAAMRTCLSEVETDAHHPLPRRNLQVHEMGILHRQHVGEELYPYGEYGNVKLKVLPGRVSLPKSLSDSSLVPVLKEKTRSWWGRMKVIWVDSRVPYLDCTLGTVLITVLYLGLNVLCLFLGSTKDHGRAWGSLAAANTLLLVVPAARNSILAMGLGMPFDQVVVFHRFFGRFAVLCVLIHALYYVFAYNRSPWIYMTGMGGLACGVVIYITSMNYVRRQFFNIFYWSHYSFVLYLILAWNHVPQTKPFIMMAVILYGADKALRWLWMWWPRKTTVFRLKIDNVVQFFGMHHVGQYYFVNFPELSVSEWHPFSVSSGPREENIELHIRGLGDHTNRIVELAAKKAKLPVGSEDADTTICIDGPYGLQDFAYHRYPYMLLAAGGIGLTPVMGILRDVYDIGLDKNAYCQPHAMETIYLMWVMPHIADYECFREEIEMCVERAKDPNKPDLVLLVYVTRAEEKLHTPFHAGRPNISNVFKSIMKKHSPIRAGLVFACGPQPLVAELWDKSIQCTMKGRQIDFHHEIFDF